jgi:hypothetical protein
MGLGYQPIDLGPDERVIRPSAAAGHVERTMAGGRLLMTNKRLVWQPSWYSRKVLSSAVVELEVAAIEKVDIAPPQPVQFVGGMRKRMRVHMKDGSEQLFMITGGGLNGYTAELTAAVSAASSSQTQSPSR